MGIEDALDDGVIGESLDELAEIGVTISLLLTRKCNLQCDHCMYSSSPDEPGAYMTYRLLTRIMDQIGAMRVGRESLTINLIGGEPTVSMAAFRRCLDSIMRMADGIPVTMSTNGWWLGRVAAARRFHEITRRYANEPELFMVRVSNDIYHRGRLGLDAGSALENWKDEYGIGDNGWIWAEPYRETARYVIPIGRGANIGYDNRGNCNAGASVSTWPNGRFVELPWGNVYENKLDVFVAVEYLRRKTENGLGCSSCRERAWTFVKSPLFPELCKATEARLEARRDD